MKTQSTLLNWEVSKYLFLILLGVSGLMEKLKTSLDHGLTPVDFETRAQQFGSNFKAA